MDKCKLPRIPTHLKKNQPLLSMSDIEEAKEMLNTNSQRFVAKHFGVSRACIVRNCIPKMKEYYRKKAREWDRNNPEKARARKAKQMLNAYHLVTNIYPEEMKVYRKQQKDKIGKEYFKIKQREYRKKLRLQGQILPPQRFCNL